MIGHWSIFVPVIRPRCFAGESSDYTRWSDTATPSRNVSIELNEFHYHICRYRHLHHANSCSTKKPTHQDHSYVNCSTLDNSRNDAEDTYKLNRYASSEFVKEKVYNERTDNTTPVKQTIRRYPFVSSVKYSLMSNI